MSLFKFRPNLKNLTLLTSFGVIEILDLMGFGYYMAYFHIEFIDFIYFKI